MEHNHSHTPLSGGESPEEISALLKYMIDHNSHHAGELHSLAHGTNGEVSEKIHAAASDLESSNEKLRQALALFEGGEK